MAKEIELKLALPESAQRRFPYHPLLKRAVRQYATTLVNIYYDTPDLALRRQGIALRLRRQGGLWLQTVKCAGDSAGGLSARPEWETPYNGQFDFSPIDDPDVRARLERRKIAARLAPVCETSFRRTVWHLDDVLLMRDLGWIVAAGRREPISEIELELDGGQLDTLLAMAEQLAERLPLVPALRSKAERGYRLFQGLPATPTKAAPLPADLIQLTPPAAFRHIALVCLGHLQHNHEGAVASDDPEYIHQMRVATRRLRACLRVFAPLLPESFVAAILPPLRTLMGLLGLVRDLDVLLEEIAAPVTAALPSEPRLAALAGVITDRRYHARVHAKHHLDAAQYGQQVLRILALLHQLPADNTSATTSADNITLDAFAGDSLHRLARKVRRQASDARPDDPVALHELRIAVKRLRYALEFFAPVNHGKARQHLARQLSEVQTTLGALNDLAAAGRLLMDCAGEDLRLREAVTLIGGWHGPRHATLMKQIPALLKDLRRLPKQP